MSKLLQKTFIYTLIFTFYNTFNPLGAKEEHVKITIIKSKNLIQYENAFDGFQEELNEARISFRAKVFNLEDKNKSISEIIKDINLNKPDLILTIGTEASQLISNRVNEIPIVFTMVLNPKAQGLKRNLTQSLNYLSGACLDVPIEIQLNNLKQVFPQLKKIAVLYNPQQDSALIEQANKSAKKFGFEFITVMAMSEKEILSGLEIIRSQSELLWLLPNPYTMSYSSLKHVFKFCIYNNFPVFGLSEFHVKAGALLAVRADYHDSGRQAGELAAQILTSGVFDHQVLIEPQRTKLFINKKTAKKMGIEIPEKILMQAEEIYE